MCIFFYIFVHREILNEQIMKTTKNTQSKKNLKEHIVEYFLKRNKRKKYYTHL